MCPGRQPERRLARRQEQRRAIEGDVRPGLDAGHLQLRKLAAKQLAVRKRLLVGLGIERRLAVAQRQLEIVVCGERLIEVDQRDRGVVADGRVIPNAQRLAVLRQRRRVFGVLEQLVALFEQLQRLLLRVFGDALGPRSIGSLGGRDGLRPRDGGERHDARQNRNRFRKHGANG